MNTGFFVKTMKGLLMCVCVACLVLSACGVPSTPEPTPYGAVMPATALAPGTPPAMETPEIFVPEQHPLSNPYRNFAYWYKGQTHTHTALGPDETGPDNLPEDQVIALYRNAGYDFLAITEHNSVRISDLASQVMVAIPGCESGQQCENHLVALGVAGCPEECCSNTGARVFCGKTSEPPCHAPENQRRVCQVATEPLGFAILAHPASVYEKNIGTATAYIQDGWSAEKMKYVKGYNAVEIVTGSSRFLWEWDWLLDEDRQVWAVASDDFHQAKDLGKGWIVVNSAKSPTDARDLLHNMLHGNFYAVRRWLCDPIIYPDPETDCERPRTARCGEPAVTGRWPRFGGVYDTGSSVRVVGTGARVVYFIQSRSRYVKDNSSLLYTQVTDGDVDDRGTPMPFSATYDWSPSTGKPSPRAYLRIELEDGCGNVAYSQPLFVKEAGNPVWNNAPDCSGGATNEALAFDYDGDGDDDLFLYRPGSGAAWVVHSNGDGTFSGVYGEGGSPDSPGGGIAGYSLHDPEDRALAFDYDGDGDDDLFLYRPGAGAAWVVGSNGDGTFSDVYGEPGGDLSPGGGIAGFDLLDPGDRVLAFDYDGDGDDDLFLYRPGIDVAWVARSNGDGTFAGVLVNPR